MEDPRFGRHLCVDMQRMFAEETPWNVPWMQKVREAVAVLSDAHAPETIFTRFIPPQDPSDAHGTWRHYFEKWPMMTRQSLGDEMVDILPELRAMAPPAVVFDKPVTRLGSMVGYTASCKSRKSPRPQLVAMKRFPPTAGCCPRAAGGLSVLFETWTRSKDSLPSLCACLRLLRAALTRSGSLTCRRQKISCSHSDHILLMEMEIQPIFTINVLQVSRPKTVAPL